MLKALETRSVVRALDEATDAARAVGVERVPAIAWGGRLFGGDEGVDEAAAALAAAR